MNGSVVEPDRIWWRVPLIQFFGGPRDGEGVEIDSPVPLLFHDPRSPEGADEYRLGQFSMSDGTAKPVYIWQAFDITRLMQG